MRSISNIDAEPSTYRESLINSSKTIDYLQCNFDY
jgi:hypothetical protein